MRTSLAEIELARAHWWQIYCKCRQIGKAWEVNPDKNKTVSVADMQELQDPCRIVQQTTKGILWSYLDCCRSEGQMSLKKDPSTGLRITSVWLWTYFGHCLLDLSETFQRYQKGQETEERFTAQEQLEFYQRSSTFFLHLLNKVRIGLPEQNQDSIGLEGLDGISYVQVARSLIFLLSEYCHLDVNIPRVLDVETALREAILSDAYFYLTREQYRDHIFHVVDVCLLGLFLLNCRFSEGQTLVTHISELVYGNPNSEKIVIQNWFLAALFHDIGYSLESKERRRKELQQESGGQKALGDQWQRIIKIEELHVHQRNLAELELRKAKYGRNFPIHLMYDIEAEQEEVDRLEAELKHWSMRKTGRAVTKQPPSSESTSEETGKLDHGEHSCKYVKEILETLPGDSEALLKAFTPALEAIRKHNLMEEERKIVFSDEPLSFLLILCDELQEWGRARVDVLELGEQLVSKVNFPDPSILSINRLLEYLVVNIELDEETRRGIIPNRTLDFYLFYKDATKEQFEPLAIWLLKSFNLQRMHISEDVLRITVTMRNPICKGLGRIASPDVCEFNILRNFMRDRRKWRELEDWIEGKDAVEWKVDRGDNPDQRIEAENVILHLNKFADVELLHDNPSEIFDDLFQWRREYISGRRRRL